MSSIERYSGPGRGISRQTGRALANLECSTVVTLAEIEAAADVQASKVDTMTGITQRGLQGAAYISSVEAVLAEATPSAAGRLNLIGNTGSMSLAQIVTDSATILRRI